MKTEAGDMTLIAVGGGAFLIPDKMAGVSQVIHVEHGDSRQRRGRRHRPGLGRMRSDLQGPPRVSKQFPPHGASPTIVPWPRAPRAPTLSTIESEDMPLAYLPGSSVRVRVRVVGDVAGS